MSHPSDAFESYVISSGSKTLRPNFAPNVMFESYVISSGSKTQQKNPIDPYVV